MIMMMIVVVGTVIGFMGFSLGVAEWRVVAVGMGNGMVFVSVLIDILNDRKV